MPNATKLRRELRKLLKTEGLTAEQVIDLVRSVTMNDADSFAELYPPGEFYGTVYRRAPDSVLRQKMRMANRKSLEKQAAKRAARQSEVLEFLKGKGDNLTLAEMAAMLNCSEIKPARGPAWTMLMVHRLLADVKDQDDEDDGS